MKLVDGVLVPHSPEDIAQRAQDVVDSVALKAAEAARRAAREAALEETPASVTSVPELRDKVNEILRLLRVNYDSSV